MPALDAAADAIAGHTVELPTRWRDDAGPRVPTPATMTHALPFVRALFGVAMVAAVPAQQTAEPSGSPAAAVAFDPAAEVQRGCDLLVGLAEGENQGEWPYEGVYRTREAGSRRPVIPIGYRVGGTAIVCSALVAAPGYAQATQRKAAVERGVQFILGALDHELMQPSTANTYDVRGWGHIYALELFVTLRRGRLVPEALAEQVERRIKWLVETLHTEALPRVGGWNYANRNSAAPFMTGPALQTLFAAAQAGEAVDAQMVTAALDALERARAKSGSVAYGVPAESRADTEEKQLRFMDLLPGAMGRMLATETTLMLAGRGSQPRLRTAIDTFFAHWDQLEVRRKKSGTHVQPYGVAPYYVIYAHAFAAQAIEMLEDADARTVARERLYGLLAKIAEPEGGWNDREFARSRAFGTAMIVMALLQPNAEKRAAWRAPEGAAATTPPAAEPSQKKTGG